MYYYSSRPKMSASAAGAAGVGAGGARRLQNGSRCAVGGGCGELVNGDGRFSAVVATATTTTPTECCDTESCVAEAQTNSDWDKASIAAASPPCTNAEPGSGRQKKNNSSSPSFFVNGSTDGIITRERAGACGQYGDPGGLGGGCSAVGRQSDGPGEDNGINIDHEPEGSRYGGERLCFMVPASSRSERRACKPQAPVTGRRNYNVKGQTQTKGAAASMTAAARCGNQNAESANSKRRGCSYTRASKRVCYAGTARAGDCGSLGTGSETQQDSGDTPRIFPESHSSGVSEKSNGRQWLGSEQATEDVGEKCQIRRTSATGSHKSNSTVCPRVAGDASNVNSNDMMPPCQTSKGRVRLYRVRSFLASTSGYHNGHGENGRYNLNGSSRPSPPSQDKAVLPRKHSSPVADISEQRGNGGSNGRGSSSPDAAVAEMPGADRSDAAEAEDTQVKLEAQVERASGEASRRQVELEERSERVLRRLQAVQVKQVERHVSQQLQGLSRRPSQGSGDRKPAAVLSHSSRRRELSRLAHSCSEVLSAAGGALDSDHTASSSGGSSESEEDDDEDEGSVMKGWTHTRSAKAVRRATELQWAQERARLGSRWVWLQAQVSELEYRIRALTELYTHLRQGKVRTGPETPLRAPRPPPPQNSATCRSSSAGEPLRKTKAEDAVPSPQPPLASAARVCPLPRLRRHKLLRLEACPALGSKPVSLPCVCEPSVVCVLCGGGPPRPPPDPRECVEQRRSRLDLCVHPVLTLPSDIPLVVQCGTSPLVGGSQNALRRTGVPAHAAGVGRRGQGTQRAGRVRRRLMCPRPPNTLPPLQHSTGGTCGRNYRGVVSPGLLNQRITDLPPLSTTPLVPGTSNQPLRRRRGESSFDIDNLVMPVGLAGLGARVQKLQYKEIITPSWRELDDEREVPHPALLDSTLSHQQEEPQGDAESEEVEDMSDGSFLSRHAVCENRERGRWRNWAHRRRRGRSSSFHGEGRWSSKLLEGSPSSPDPRQGYPTEGEISPASPFPFTDPEDASLFLPEEEQQVMLPWERRTFPLLEAELAALQEEEEEEEHCEGEGSGRSQSTDSGISLGSLELSPRTPQPAAPPPATSSTQDPPCPARSPIPAAFLPRPPLSPHTLHPAFTVRRQSRSDAP
ncbi:KAT8 regulatory NSL complex subunit 1 [Alosa sapidissima]|uniref:KAT8 regulatory NSL complex subunit 1 n=1 Tax=Alosa sapidissima TaxID=34773 RepID=UPI001C08D3E8|nr:KAT8 regulatory NSL complex subunit 1 [Alosa sapidissima]XP_041932873.1 KAT8 regulatory NSL complex subunit 1 [Alosa sapidissima]